ncbi:MAG: fimbrial protein [Bacteroidales bacterium]
MKKIKQFSLKATLLTIVAALTIGFTGCSDELSGDQTQGKPGYLTLNLKTLKPKQTKFAGANADDYKTLNDLNIFVFDGNTLILNKYVNTGLSDDGLPNSIEIRVGTLPLTARVVAVANYGSRMSAITDSADLAELSVSTVGDFTSNLLMTGESGIAVDGLNYTASVLVAPITSKINVGFTLSGDAAYYGVTGIYIVNAVDSTLLPIIQPSNAISHIITPAVKTAKTGLTGVGSRDYHIYNSALSTHLKDEASATDSLRYANTFTYYVGENYHANIPGTRGTGTLFANDAANTAANANTLIVVKVTPKPISDGGLPSIIAMGDKYYTYDLSSAITPSNDVITGIATTGFSTKRKTNYHVTFNLTDFGTTNPFEQLSKLTVTVTASPWENAGNTTAGF